jgi:nucleotidyltransferase/DNA polymerase involved in DNA repair
LSNNDGCIIARSPEAKALGLAMGAPYHLNRETLTRHNVDIFSSNYALYGDMSRRVMETLAAQAPEVEVYSIDEAFLNLAGIEVGEVWGVGRRWAAWLEGQGIRSALDLKHAEAKAVRRKMTVVGERLVYDMS